jgi:hypothetical protein
MPLNASGPISLAGSSAGQSIALELNLGATSQISLNDAAVRTLAGVPSGAIVMPTDFYGKSNLPIFIGYRGFSTPGDSIVTNYTFTASLGGSATNRFTVVYCGNVDNAGFGCTIGGIAATQVLSYSVTFRTHRVFIANTSSLSDSVSIVITGQTRRAGVGVWSMNNLISATPTQILNTDQSSISGVSASAGSILFGLTYNADTAVHSWSGGGLVSNYDVNIASQAWTSGASAQQASAFSGTVNKGVGGRAVFSTVVFR